MKALRSLLIAAAASVMFSGSAMAAVLYDNGAATHASTQPMGTGGAYSSISDYAVDNFTLGSNSTINSIFWTVKLFGQTPLTGFNGARALILSAPGPLSSPNILHTISLQAGNPTSNAFTTGGYDLTLSGLSINLNAGAYWIALQTDFGSGSGLGASGIVGTAASNSQVWRTTGSSAVVVNQAELAFRIEGTGGSASVPVPSTLALLLLGGLAAPIVGRRFAR